METTADITDMIETKNKQSHNNEKASDTNKKVRGSHVVRRAATRIKVLEAGIQLLHDEGYHAASTSKVAQHAKVSRGALLHQFPTHADLMLGIVEHIIVKNQERTTKMLSSLETGMEQYKGLSDVLWEKSKTPDSMALLEIILASRSVPELLRGLEWRIKSLINTELDHAIHLAKEAGIHNDKSVNKISTLTVATVWGLSIMQLGLWSRDEADEAFDLFKNNRDQMIQKIIDEDNKA